MEPADAIEYMESEDRSAFLNDINDILNGTVVPPEVQTTSAMPQSSPPLSYSLQQQPQSSQRRTSSQKPYIKLVEQPAGKALRFRYECEGRSAGSIPGVNSTPENKTYPTIEIVGYKGEVVILVSCVTKDPPYRPHPHNLVGKDGCKEGICSLKLTGEPLRATFSNLGIQCVKKKDIRAALEVRESKKVDPFKTKFGHKDQPSSIDLNVVRLCFQAFLKTPKGVKELTPVVSDPIYDKKAMSDLVICRLCSTSGKIEGGNEIILLCEKVAKDDIRVKFYELDNDGQEGWHAYADFQQTDIHKQTAIAFKTPRYHSTDLKENAQVYLQLERPSDKATSDPVQFDYHPDPDELKRKRVRTGGNEALKELKLKLEQNPNFFNDLSTNSPQFGLRRSPNLMTPSPQPMQAMSQCTPQGYEPQQFLGVFIKNEIDNVPVQHQQQQQHQQAGDPYGYMQLNNNFFEPPQNTTVPYGLNTLLQDMNIEANVPQQQQQQQQHHQHQPQFQQQHPQQPSAHFQYQEQQIDIDFSMLTSASTEGENTLNNLGALDNGQFVNLPLDLPLSNISLST